MYVDMNYCEIPYSFRVVFWMVGEFLDLENLLFLLRLSNDLCSRVELPAHYHQVLRLSQGVDRTASAERAFIITSLQLIFLIFYSKTSLLPFRAKKAQWRSQDCI